MIHSLLKIHFNYRWNPILKIYKSWVMVLMVLKYYPVCPTMLFITILIGNFDWYCNINCVIATIIANFLYLHNFVPSYGTKLAFIFSLPMRAHLVSGRGARASVSVTSPTEALDKTSRTDAGIYFKSSRAKSLVFFHHLVSLLV